MPDATEPPHVDHAVDLAFALPPAVAEDQPSGFPLLATIAPIAGAVVLWLITGSPLSLVFAALGPVVAVASILDSRRQARVRSRRAAASRATAITDLEARVANAHARERAAGRRRSPTARQVLRMVHGEHWGPAPHVHVVVGRGPVPSTVRVTGAPADDSDRAFLARSSVVADGQVVVDGAAGVGFVGPLLLAEAAARAVLVQVGHRSAPGAIGVRAPDTPGWAWAADLPHHGTSTVVEIVDAGDGEGRGAVRSGPPASPGASRLVIAVAAEAGLVPPDVRTVIRIRTPTRAVVEREAGMPGAREIVPDLVSAAEAAGWAAGQRRAAERAGLGGAAALLPRTVPFDALEQGRRDPGDRGSLAVVVGRAAAGPLSIDLVRDGPHALVAGTSGSGKSEFLLTWLTAMAVAHPPGLVAFLLVDFKGGAAFEPLRGLPHVAGIVTDLDESEARRAVESLRAELGRRERLLRDVGARDVSALTPDVELPRLVIVIDEYQAMVGRFPELGDLIADIAARGRSLGVHLVLAAQRPNGVVRDQVSANCGLRVSMRVLERGDSTAVIGDPRAAELDASAPGRAIVATAERGPVEFQAACASEVLPVIRAQITGRAVRRPWLDPLPARIAADDVARLVGADDRTTTDGIVFGVLDDPERQRRRLAKWHPQSEGNLIVVGRPGSGRTTALGAIARGFAARHGTGSVVVLGGPRSAEWDALHEELDRVRAQALGASRLLVVDDVEARYRTWPEEHRCEAQAVIEALLREGRSAGLRVAASATSSQALPVGLREAFTSAVLLQHASRADLVHSGGDGALWRVGEPAGGGQWQGLRARVVDTGPPALPAERPVPPLRVRPDRPLAVCTDAVDVDARTLRATLGREVVELGAGAPSPRDLLEALDPGAERTGGRAAGARGEARPPLVVADADGWAANWAILAAVRERGTIVVHGGAAEYRAVARDRRVPPLLDAGRGQCLVLSAGAPTRRCIWPSR
ncbi:FtsK/SpoIIIE domain-containing protein [Agromyces sp. LHK192]|uniref:FtsK/SpoIIIE domain-containing protein n=1 Tax=Agromyces sp. LHK192 TaxID=2498704 RepID=UPI000FDA5FC7|nr:FtsK/SpoIIIE domain-containing protein [Agromyces sp. LHK192]